jgi:hypothetical protein
VLFGSIPRTKRAADDDDDDDDAVEEGGGKRGLHTRLTQFRCNDNKGIRVRVLLLVFVFFVVDSVLFMFTHESLSSQ